MFVSRCDFDEVKVRIRDDEKAFFVRLKRLLYLVDKAYCIVQCRTKIGTRYGFGRVKVAGRAERISWGTGEYAFRHPSVRQVRGGEEEVDEDRCRHGQ